VSNRSFWRWLARLPLRAFNSLRGKADVETRLMLRFFGLALGGWLLIACGLTFATRWIWVLSGIPVGALIMLYALFDYGFVGEDA
jgi:hypothetical protein